MILAVSQHSLMLWVHFITTDHDFFLILGRQKEIPNFLMDSKNKICQVS